MPEKLKEWKCVNVNETTEHITSVFLTSRSPNELSIHHGIVN